MTAPSEHAIVSGMNHPVRRHPARDRIVDIEVMKLELRQARARDASDRRVTHLPLQRASTPELRRAA
jgi:hypothetical protein